MSPVGVGYYSFIPDSKKNINLYYVWETLVHFIAVICYKVLCTFIIFLFKVSKGFYKKWYEMCIMYSSWQNKCNT